MKLSRKTDLQDDILIFTGIWKSEITAGRLFFGLSLRNKFLVSQEESIMKNYLRKFVAFSAACAMSAGVTAPLSALADVNENTTVTVTATATDGTSFLFNNSELTVAADEAESFGYTDEVTEGVSTLDVLVKMHEEKYGEDFKPETAADYLEIYDGWITKVFESRNGLGYRVNCEEVDSLANVTKDNDVFEAFFYQDTANWADVYCHIDDIETAVGLETVINVNNNGTPLVGAQLATIDENGAITVIDGISADVKGNIKVKFDAAGTYYVTLTGTSKQPVVTNWTTMETTDMDCPVIPSVTKITVVDGVVIDAATAVYDGFFFSNNENLAVSKNEAESFGYTDTITDGVSALDVLVKMHEVSYGELFNTESASDYLVLSESGWITKVFGETDSIGYSVNSKYTPSLAVKMENGDTFELFFYQDTASYLDYYAHTDDFTALVGEEVTLNANGWIYAYSYESPSETSGEDIKLAYVNKDGTISDPIENAVADGNGDITVSFDKAGTYYITFVGTNSSDIPVIPSVTKVTVYSVDDIISATTKTIGKSTLTYGSEWKVIGLARNGCSVPESYYESVMEKAADSEGIKRATDAERTIIALTAIGKTADSRLLGMLASKDFVVTNGGLMSSIYGLLALDSGNYAIPENSDAEDQNTREIMINDILAHQLVDGGIAFSAMWGADVDTTAMAVQALAKYADDNADVNTAIEKALAYINANTGSLQYDVCSSLAQVITAYSVAGEDAKDYVKMMLEYYDGNGHFIYNSKVNDMTTTQAYYALVAYSRFVNDKNSLYDMADAKYSIKAVTGGTCTIYAPFEASAKLVCVTYDENNILTDVEILDAELEACSDNVIENVPECSTVMLWGSLENMIPMCGVYSE